MSNPSGSNAISGYKFSPGFIRGMTVSWLSNTTLGVSSGSCVDSTNVSNVFLDTGVTINCANVGLNGMDVGALAASSTYYVHSISNSLDKTKQGAVLSLSATNPYLPQGFDMFRMVDYQKTDGSSHLILSRNTGSGNQRTKQWDAGVSVLSAGAASSLTAIDLSAALPLGMSGVSVDLAVAFTPASAGNTVGFTPFGSTATAIAKLGAAVASVAQNAVIPNLLSVLDSGVPKILYINSVGSCSTTALVTKVHFEV